MKTFCDECSNNQVEINGDFLLCKRGNFFAGGGPKFLYVRSHYRNIFNIIEAQYQIQETNKILLLGSPGIGKSCFINYFIYRTLSVLKKRKLFIEYRCLHSDKSPLVRQQISSAWGEKSDDSETVLILDGVPCGDLDHLDFKLILMVSSPSISRYSNFVDATTLAMPVWSSEEIHFLFEKMFQNAAADEKKQKFEVIQIRHKIFGGNARRVFIGLSLGTALFFNDVKTVASDTLRRLLSEQKIEKVDKASLAILTVKVNATQDALLWLPDKDVSDDKNISSMLIHWDVAIDGPSPYAWDIGANERYFPASAFCSKLVYVLIKSNESKFFNAIRQNSAFFGCLFEQWCHNEVPLVKEGIDVRDLFDNQCLELPINCVGVSHIFSAGAEVKAQPIGVYLYPSNRNFPAIDALIKTAPDAAVLFQFTVSDSHPNTISVESKLQAFLAEAGLDVKKCLVVFGIPQRRHFSGVQDHFLDMKQYVMYFGLSGVVVSAFSFGNLFCGCSVAYIYFMIA